ncbi:hypothetical protein VT84_28475 [Gemmata sp. SH-PL17]|nr:hypothetical protein VT84_28475 [Gemmata sp. SH-PL17]
MCSSIGFEPLTGRLTPAVHLKSWRTARANGRMELRI